LSGCTGLKAAKPFAPSLNQRRSCRFVTVNTAAGIASMFGRVASPIATVNSPLVRPTLTAAAGWLPLTLVPSLLQKVV
jgi:hypothetical protein